MAAINYIDGLGLKATFGAFIPRGGYNDLLVFPAMKKPTTNDWPEEDGIEVDLTDPVLEAKEVGISFLVSDPAKDVREFLATVSEPGYHTIGITSLGRNWSLRLTDHSENKIYPNASLFTLRFVEDLPLRPVSASYSCGVVVPVSSYNIDTISLDQYGIVVMTAKDEVCKLPSVKQNLTTASAYRDGQTYDVATLVFNSKETTFKCRLKAASMSQFWACYDALFYSLIQPGERQLYVSYLDQSFPCYYSKSGNFVIRSLGTPVVVDFDLTLVFTKFRLQ